MAYRHGKGTKVLYGAYDLSTFATEVSVSNKFETAESTTLGSTAKSYIAGLQDATISLKGLFEGSATATDSVMDTYISADSDPAITVAPDGGLTQGSRAYVAKVQSTSKEVGAPVGDIVSLNAEFQCDGGARGGIVLDSRTDSASANGTSVDNTAATTAGATANLHVTANTRSTTSVIKVQHSTDGSTWVDLITFATVAATTIANENQTAGVLTIRQYLRAISTLTAGTGSITFTVSIARSKN